MITAGSIPVGARLPTVRELSRRLGVSPTTVSEAWRSLADVGAIEARGRNGTFVRPPTGPGGPRRYRRVTEGPGHFALDLSTGTPDPDLLPDLGPVIARVSRQSLTSSYLDHPVLPALEEALRRLVAVRARGDHRRRRGDGRPRPRRPGGAAPRRPGRRRAPDVPAAARPARAARLRGHRRRPRRRGDVGRRAACGAGERRRRGRSCSSPGPTTRPVWRSAGGGRSSWPALLAADGDDRGRGRPRQRHLDRPAREPRAGGCRSARCTSAATPRATAPTCAWPPSAARATS